MARLTRDSGEPITTFVQHIPNLWDITDPLLAAASPIDEATCRRGAIVLDRALKAWACWDLSTNLPWETSEPISKEIVQFLMGASKLGDLVQSFSGVRLNQDAARPPSVFGRSLSMTADPVEAAIIATLYARFPRLSNPRGPNIHVTYLPGESPATVEAKVAKYDAERECVRPRVEAMVSMWVLFIFACEDQTVLVEAINSGKSEFVREVAKFTFDVLEKN